MTCPLLQNKKMVIIFYCARGVRALFCASKPEIQNLYIEFKYICINLFMLK